MTFLDFFSGIGGFRKGLELCGMVCKGHCEIDKYAERSYRAIFDIKEDEWYGNDITKVRAEELPRVDLWCGGFPCQDVSVSGKQRGLAGARSGLFFEVVRLLQSTPSEERPNWIILENVKNLLSINRGWDFAAVLIALSDLGYHIEYGLLNSKFHGVPQNRERVYIVAYRHFRADSGRKVFPVTAGDSKALIRLIDGTQGKRVYDAAGIGCTLTASSGGFGGKTGLYFIDLTAGNPRLTETAHCIKAKYTSGVTNRRSDNSGVYYGCRAVISPDRTHIRQNGRRFKECGEPAYCLTTMDKHGVMLCDCTVCEKSETDAVVCGRIRRLTPRECWRLQGFGDDMFDRAASVNSDSQLYKQAGNSVTIPVVYAVGQRITEIQNELDSERNERS